MPVLLSTHERKAYGYLTGEMGASSPAWVERADDETEVDAIKRLRGTRSACLDMPQRVGQWEAFERGLKAQNAAALARLLHGAG